MISLGSPNKGLTVLAVFAVVAFVLLPVCPLPLPDASGSGCHSESAPDMPDTPDMPSQQQQSCCFVATHFQPGILNAGLTVSFAAISMVAETGESNLLQIFLVPELKIFRQDFSPPLNTVFRV